MNRRSIRLVTVAVAIVGALAGPHVAIAQVKLIEACYPQQPPLTESTTYRLTKDLIGCGLCLIVMNDRITIDLQGHSITSTCSYGAGIADEFLLTGEFTRHDLITITNGSIGGFDAGILLPVSNRVSVLRMKTANNNINGVWVGSQSLVKYTEAYGNGDGIEVGPYSQVQQSSAHDNMFSGIIANGPNCLITMNTANSNLVGIWLTDTTVRCTVSHNTVNDNQFMGIDAGTSSGQVYGGPSIGHLITHNVALRNRGFDYSVNCPSTVTNNRSTNGFPASYLLIGDGCHTVNNY